MNIPALSKLDAMLIVSHSIPISRQQRGSLGDYPKKTFWSMLKRVDTFGTELSKLCAPSDNETTMRNDDKWWLPIVKVPKNVPSEASRRRLLHQKESVNQVLKAAMAINVHVLTEVEISEDYIEALPQNGRESLDDLIYKYITDDYFDPEDFLSSMDLSTKHKVLDLKDRIEASIMIWRRKMHGKDAKSSSPWGLTMRMERWELFEERAETILLLIKQRFPGAPQSALDISKIQYNKASSESILTHSTCSQRF
ncbi:hypothetical protein MLD38_014789 [Melastoma candidum]|uniref:Uncharacterized protein n=1 Tax=Melastoma candidum TaxID=119954 RepID=A0ACB9RHM4_9MYRT|nr:hypothetical protein MLD38_014789 [Melastoma candidum]